MKITIRLIISLILVVALVAITFSFYQVASERRRLVGELEKRSVILAESLQESIIPLLKSNSVSRLNSLMERFGNRKMLKGIAVFTREGNIITSTSDLAPYISKPLLLVVNSIAESRSIDGFINIADKKTYIYNLPISSEDELIGCLSIFQDASYIDVRLKEIWRHNLFSFLILSILIVAITVLVIHFSITGPIAQFAEWLKDLRLGRGKISQIKFQRGDILAPLISEITHLAKSLSIARARAEEEARLRVKGESIWTPNRLKEHIRVKLKGRKLFLVSNREPYMHVKDGRDIKCIVPAGGLVTALDPVMRISNGIWIAHGASEVDKEVVDTNDRLPVPPHEPAYTLRRVWLTKEEEEGYYYGFSNEGFWPLCHITHTRPIFRQQDWIYYQKVNEKFADVLLAEIANEKSPLILINDYHLALLPILIKKKRPDAKVSLFWHIPWPNPEVYGICPWREEILIGILGADIIGFHIQFHCNNFLETIDRFLESKINWEQFSVERGGHITMVKPFPISVSFDSALDKKDISHKRVLLKEAIFKEINVSSKYLGVGVDRIDYTKGILERLRSIERFLEKYPEFVSEFTFVELGAPSRIHIKKYRDLTGEIEELVDKINWAFQTKRWSPIVFLKGHHSHQEILPFYKAADVCMVTSLHDGMNLVSKEFVAASDDEDGVLILSQFTGASRELKDAIIVNPYDIEKMADAIYLSLTMEQNERFSRMKRMRAIVRENNIYRWAGNLVTELARL